MGDQMTDKRKAQTVQQSRRKVIKRLTASGAIVTAAMSMPREWSKPVIDVVLLPAHAVTSPVPYSLTVINIAVLGGTPQACSGNVFPPIDITGEFSLTGCSAANILNITSNLPGTASLDASFAVGDALGNGAVFALMVNNFPSSSPFACQATEAASITIEYNCADFDGPSQSVSIDILEELLKASS